MDQLDTERMVHYTSYLKAILGRDQMHSYRCLHDYNNSSIVFREELLDDAADGQGSPRLLWRMPYPEYSAKKSKNLGINLKKLPKNVRLFYEQQDELIEAYEETATESRLDLHIKNAPDEGNIVTQLSVITLIINLGLVVAKAVALGMSHSLSILSSLVDSVVDLFSGIIIWWTSHTIKTSDVYVYPVGRSRLEPVAIVILSAVMSLASLEVIITAVMKIIKFTKSKEEIAIFELQTLIIAGSTVVIKFIMAVSYYLLMKRKRLQLAPVDALIQDQRNDTLSNSTAILFGYLGSKQFSERVISPWPTLAHNMAYIDPAGAILIAIYIIMSWIETGSEQLDWIAGITATPSFLSKITWIALNHSPQILCIDTVRAFHFGSKFLVEVGIVLKADTILAESHDIGQSLQHKLERLPEVERAFVQVNFLCPTLEVNTSSLT